MDAMTKSPTAVPVDQVNDALDELVSVLAAVEAIMDMCAEIGDRPTGLRGDGLWALLEWPREELTRAISVLKH